MEKDSNSRFVCKFCDKKFPCGKSLGGHIRSHVIAAAESEETLETMDNYPSDGGFLKMKAVTAPESNEFGGASGYGLRENPKRTWRAVDSTFSLPQQRVCKQCGKGFQSLKALCGHMACHSEKERVLREDYSWTTENTKLVDSDSDNEDQMMRLTRSRTKRYNKQSVVKSSNFVNDVGAYSPVSGIEEQDTEDVAMCLMMLSRDSGYWGGINSVVESSDNNSVVLETKSSSIDMKTGKNEGLNFGDEALMKRKLKSSALDSKGVHFEKSCSGYRRNGLTEAESDSSFDELLGNGEYKKRSNVDLGMIYNKGKPYGTEQSKGMNMENEFGEVGGGSKLLKFDSKKRARGDDYDFIYVERSKDSQKRRKYKCSNCNKTFGSYQALGGHRPCHKRTNSSFRFEYGSDDESLEDDKVTRTPTTPIRMLGENSNNKKPVARDFAVGAEKRIKPKKNKGHQCPFCPRLFKSGQALGGHKRSHFINASGDFVSPTPEIKQEAPAEDAAATRKLIDLNLPAPEEDVEPDDNPYICLD